MLFNLLYMYNFQLSLTLFSTFTTTSQTQELILMQAGVVAIQRYLRDKLSIEHLDERLYIL